MKKRIDEASGLRPQSAGVRHQGTARVFRLYLGAAAMVVVASHDAWAQSGPQTIRGPDTVEFKSGALALRGLVWRPAGRGPFPAILFTHGSGRAVYAREMASIGPFYASHGYVLFWPYRRGQGLSEGRGEYIVDLMDRA